MDGKPEFGCEQSVCGKERRALKGSWYSVKIDRYIDEKKDGKG